MSISFQIVVFLILLALAFDFLNGFHDAANSIATIVSTGALCGAITWNLITWYYGIPSSSSHALVGGIIGAGVAKAGVSKLVASGVLKTAAAIVISPLFGFVLAIALMIAVSWIFARSTPRRVDRWFRRLQFVSAANEPLPFRVVLACQAAMGLGTLFGGWRIVKTMGMRITKLKPVGGFCASASGAMTLFLATALGIPVSTTHTITGSIIGVGSVQKLSAVRWGVAGNIV